MKISQKRSADLQLTLQVKEGRKHTKGPILGGEHDTFGSAGSHKWNVATLNDRTPIALEGLLSQSVKSDREREINDSK